MGNHFPDFIDGHSSSRVGIFDPAVYSRQGFLVHLDFFKDRRLQLQVNHDAILAVLEGGMQPFSASMRFLPNV